jgi:hypothetical protein
MDLNQARDNFKGERSVRIVSKGQLVCACENRWPCRSPPRIPGAIGFERHTELGRKLGLREAEEFAAVAEGERRLR